MGWEWVGWHHDKLWPLSTAPKASTGLLSASAWPSWQHTVCGKISKSTRLSLPSVYHRWVSTPHRSTTPAARLQICTCHRCWSAISGFLLLTASPAPRLLINRTCSSSVNLHRYLIFGLWLILCQIFLCVRRAFLSYIIACLPGRPSLSLTWRCFLGNPPAFLYRTTRWPNPVITCELITRDFNQPQHSWICATNSDKHLPTHTHMNTKRQTGGTNIAMLICLMVNEQSWSLVC